MRRPLIALIPWLLALPVGAGQWTDWRGPDRDGRSPETGLPTRWSPAGENLAWKAPYGSRSTPVVLGDHLYLLTAVERARPGRSASSASTPTPGASSGSTGSTSS